MSDLQLRVQREEVRARNRAARTANLAQIEQRAREFNTAREQDRQQRQQAA